MLKKPNLQLDIEDAYWYAFATTRDYEDFTATILDTYFNVFFLYFCFICAAAYASLQIIHSES